MNHRHILLFNPLQSEREKVGAEAVWHPMFKARRGFFFINPKDPPTALLAHIALRIGVADHRVLRVALSAVGHQRRILLQDDKLMLNRNGWNFDAQHFCCALRMIARGGDHMLSCDHNLLLRGHKVSALFDHFRAGHLPMAAGPMKTIRLPPTLNADPQLPRALGHGHGDIRRVNIAIGLMIKRAFKIVGTDERPFGFNFIR